MNQLALALRLPEPGGFERFVADGNAEPLAALQAWAAAEGQRYLYLHGPAGSGKSHLLQAACRAVADRGGSTIYLPLDQPDLLPAILEDLEQCSAVVIDAIDQKAGDAVWERGLFDLYNRLQERNRRLLVAARVPPTNLGLGLPDLRSRLSAGAAYALRALDETGCARLLQRGARQHGLLLDDAAVSYILNRCPRNPAALWRLLADLDRLSLERQRALTVRAIGDLLGLRPPAAGRTTDGIGSAPDLGDNSAGGQGQPQNQNDSRLENQRDSQVNA
ncbi:DnaA regulatory inactivator Hda [Thiohalocapsa marina]|uniref:DnaA regulatory inactivator Hda n=1 Tax=Thiohalocapsa marina TaxID=424902 RepID=UPI0014787AF3|nr:DnaA regulatory inactivator Hda [Thiohalocapsa marina]